MSERAIIATQEMWLQTSSDYQAVKEVRSRIFRADSTVKDVLDWAASGHALQRGQPLLSYEDGPIDRERQK